MQALRIGTGGCKKYIAVTCSKLAPTYQSSYSLETITSFVLFTVRRSVLKQLASVLLCSKLRLLLMKRLPCTGGEETRLSGGDLRLIIRYSNSLYNTNV